MQFLYIIIIIISCFRFTILPCDDFFADLVKNPSLMRFMDTSNFPQDHVCYTTARKRIPGLFKFECGSRTINEFVALRAKSYAYDVEQEITIRAKGVMGHVIRNHLTFAEHKRCLFANVDDGADSDERDDEFDASTGKMIAVESARLAVARIHQNASTASTTHSSPSPVHPSHSYSYMPFTPYRENVSIRSFNHELRTIRTTKLVLNRADDKRHVLKDNISTLAHGHYLAN